jgi:hypothetical protein
MSTQIVLSKKNDISKCIGVTLSMLITLIFYCSLKNTRANHFFLQNMFADPIRDYALAIRCWYQGSLSKYWSSTNYFYLLILFIAHIPCHSYITDDNGYSYPLFLHLIILFISKNPKYRFAFLTNGDVCLVLGSLLQWYFHMVWSRHLDCLFLCLSIHFSYLSMDSSTPPVSFFHSSSASI